MLQVLACSEKNESERHTSILERIQKFVNLNYRTIPDNKTLLHLCLNERHDSTYLGICQRFPLLEVTQLFLSCRVSINAIDCHHYTPLHDFVRNRFNKATDEKLCEIEKIFKLLIDAGAHLDASAQGKTPQDCAEHERIKRLFQNHPIQLNLKCICARLIQLGQLNCIGCIPTCLQEFVELH